MEDGFEWVCQYIESLSYETWQCISYIYECRKKGNSEKVKKERCETMFLEKSWGSEQDFLRKQWELSIRQKERVGEEDKITIS